MSDWSRLGRPSSKRKQYENLTRLRALEEGPGGESGGEMNKRRKEPQEYTIFERDETGLTRYRGEPIRREPSKSPEATRADYGKESFNK